MNAPHRIADYLLTFLLIRPKCHLHNASPRWVTCIVLVNFPSTKFIMQVQLLAAALQMAVPNYL